MEKKKINMNIKKKIIKENSFKHVEINILIHPSTTHYTSMKKISTTTFAFFAHCWRAIF